MKQASADALAPITPGGVHFKDIVPGEVAGCPIAVDTLRYLPAEGDGPSCVYLLGFSGQTSVAKAAWANLIPPYCGFLRIEEGLYTLADGGRGWERRTSRFGFGVEQLVLFPPCSGRWADVSELLIIDRQGRTPADSLMRFLEYRSSIPLDGDWRLDIWRWALESAAAVALAGFGPDAWLVRLSDELLLQSLPNLTKQQD